MKIWEFTDLQLEMCSYFLSMKTIRNFQHRSAFMRYIALSSLICLITENFYIAERITSKEFAFKDSQKRLFTMKKNYLMFSNMGSRNELLGKLEQMLTHQDLMPFLRSLWNSKEWIKCLDQCALLILQDLNEELMWLIRISKQELMELRLIKVYLPWKNAFEQLIWRRNTHLFEDQN